MADRRQDKNLKEIIGKIGYRLGFRKGMNMKR